MDGDTFNQAHLLEGMFIDIKEHAYYMRKSIEQIDMKSTLIHVSNILGELRTSNLSPKYYYQLYMNIFNEMQYFASFIGDESKHGLKICDLYDSVQQVGYILPRIYLLTTAGSFYIAQHADDCRKILNDMSEMCKGVQHPMRGLFLRYYMVQVCKNKLYNYACTDYNCFKDCHEFLLHNFSESANLWVRLSQNILSIRERKRRETERLELGMLVSTNLVCLAQLEGLDYNIYATHTLPFILSEISNINDQACLQYLLDCVIQAFSDEFHLRTLNVILDATLQYLSSDNLNSILVNLMDRLSVFIPNNPKFSLEGLDIFAVFQSHINKIDLTSTKIESSLELENSFLKFTITLYPGLWEHVESILKRSIEIMRLMGVSDLPPTVESAINIITVSTESLGIKFLQYPYLEEFMEFLSFESKVEVSCRIIDIISKKYITTMPHLKSLINSCNALFVATKDEDCEVLPLSVEKNLIKQQQMIWKLLLSIDAATPDEELDMILFVQNKVVESGYRRCKLTIPSIVYRYLMLISKIGPQAKREFLPAPCYGSFEDASDRGRGGDVVNVCHAIYRFAHEAIESIVLYDPEVSIKLSILTAISANECNAVFNDFSEECYEFIVNAMIYFEDYIVDAGQQMNLIKYISGLVCFYAGAISSKISYVAPQEMESLMGRIIKSGYRFLRKKDKCRSILISSHMYWNNDLYQNSRRVWECFSKCREIANSGLYTTLADRVTMLIDIYDKAVYYTKMKVEMFNPQLVKEIEKEIQSIIQDNNVNEVQIARFNALRSGE